MRLDGRVTMALVLLIVSPSRNAQPKGTEMNTTMGTAKKISTAPRAKHLTSVPPPPSVEMLSQQVESLRSIIARMMASGSYSAIEVDNIVGQKYYARVSGESILCEVVEEVPASSKRPYKLRRCDNGRVLTRLRSRAALHTEAGPWEVPASKR